MTSQQISTVFEMYLSKFYTTNTKRFLSVLATELQSTKINQRKIRSRRQRTDIRKYSFVNRTIQHWNQLPTEVLRILPCKPITFKKRVRKVIIELN
jgi:hypothetical protein